MLLISPTEPLALRSGWSMEHKTSSTTEAFGVDFFWIANNHKWGIQRKTTSDFVASLQDGRLAKQLSQMQNLDVAVILIESQHSNTRWTAKQFSSAIMSCMDRGIWCWRAMNSAETREIIEAWYHWSQKAIHTSTHARPKHPSSSSEEFAVWILSGFPGIGPTLARRIFEKFGLPLTWTITVDDLASVEGIGPKRAQQVFESLTAGFSGS